MVTISADAQSKLRAAFDAGATAAHAARLVGISCDSARRYAKRWKIKLRDGRTQRKGSLVLPVYRGPTWIGKGQS